MERINSFLRTISLLLLIVGVLHISSNEDVQNTINTFRKFTNEIQRIAENGSLLIEKDDEAQEINLTSADIVENSTPAVVAISIYEEVPVYSGRGRRWNSGEIIGISRQQTGSGTGFFITSDGYLLTNKHVVSHSGAQYTIQMTEGLDIPARVIYRDPDNDLAIIKVEGNGYPTLELADSSKVKIGEEVIGIGNALGKYIDSVSNGSITALSRDVTVSASDGTFEELENVIQTNATLYPGDSGGPLLNSKGEVIGVNAASSVGTRRSGSISFSIPINTAKEAIREAGISG